MSQFKTSLLDAAHKIILDEVDATTTYVWDVDIWALTSSPVWMIRRLTTTSGDLAVEYANWTAYFDKVWDNRASYTYS